MSAPVAIRGYAAVFDQVFRPDSPHAMLVRPGAFRLDKPVALWVDHDELSDLGADCMRLWQDATGLAFEIEVRNDRLDWLAGQVASRKRDRVSAAFASGRTSHMEVIDGEQVEIVAQTRVDEISLLECGACDGARAWLAVCGKEQAPWEYRDLARRWAVGRQRNIIAEHRRRAPSPVAGGAAFSVRPSRHFTAHMQAPASVGKLLASPAFRAFAGEQSRLSKLVERTGG